MQEEYDTDDSGVSEEIIEKHRSTADGAISEEEYGLLIGGERDETTGGETMTAVDTTGETSPDFNEGHPRTLTGPWRPPAKPSVEVGARNRPDSVLTS